MGRVGVSSKYISHLMIFSQMVKLKHSFAVRNVILFPKEAKGVVNQKTQG